MCCQGRHQLASLTVPASAPAWLDEEACRRGCQFYQENMYARNMASLDALLMGMCIQNFYKPLVISGRTLQKSKSRYRSGFRFLYSGIFINVLFRYMETGVMLYSWYQDDVWLEGSLANRMMQRVNAMHRHVADQVREIDDLDVEVEKVFRDADIDCEAQLSDQDRILLADIATIREHTDIPQEFYDYTKDSKPFSEFDMALIQGSFFAPYLLYPEHYGVTKVPRNQLENFTHLWRTFGYYLGINDAFNAVLADFEDTKLYCHILMEKILKPCMLHLDIYGIHMAKVSIT